MISNYDEWLAGQPTNTPARVIGHAMVISFMPYSGESDMSWMKPEMDKAFNQMPDAVTGLFKERVDAQHAFSR